MPKTDKHAPGAFSWIELSTTDQNAAKTFYGSLFGWTIEDTPMGPDDFYTQFKRNGLESGAACTLRAPEIAAGVPPHWNLYVTVESADAAAKKASELGGTVLAAPFDVFTYGRMAVIRDPGGAVFSIWEPKEHIGFRVKDEHGSFCWADLNTGDREEAAKFYAHLFGWEFTPGKDDYLHIRNGEAFMGGMPPSKYLEPGVPPHWMIYIQVDNCDESTAKARDLGANICVGPMTIEDVGRFTVLGDPQKAVFALFQPMRRS